MGKCYFLFFSDHANLIVNIILTLYFSSQSFSYKSHLIKTHFAIFNKFKILFTFEIEQLKIKKPLILSMEVKLHFILNNVNKLKNFLIRIKMFKYLKNNLGSNGFLPLQETYSSLDDEKKSADELKGPIFFPHGKTLVE